MLPETSSGVSCEEYLLFPLSTVLCSVCFLAYKIENIHFAFVRKQFSKDKIIPMQNKQVASLHGVQWRRQEITEELSCAKRQSNREIRMHCCGPIQCKDACIAVLQYNVKMHALLCSKTM